MGSEYVLNSSDEDFKEKLRELAKKLQAKILFEAVAGDTTGTVLECMPWGTICYLYGALSQENVGNINTLLFIGRNQKIKGFYLSSYLSTLSLWNLWRLSS